MAIQQLEGLTELEAFALGSWRFASLHRIYTLLFETLLLLPSLSTFSDAIKRKTSLVLTRLWWTRMTSSSDFSLYSYDCFCDGEHWHYQYVFHASENVMEFPTLSRVKSVPDLLELLSGDKVWRRAGKRGLTCKVDNWMHLHASPVFDHDVLTQVELLTT